MLKKRKKEIKEEQKKDKEVKLSLEDKLEETVLWLLRQRGEGYEVVCKSGRNKYRVKGRKRREIRTEVALICDLERTGASTVLIPKGKEREVKEISILRMVYNIKG